MSLRVMILEAHNDDLLESYDGLLESYGYEYDEDDLLQEGFLTRVGQIFKGTKKYAGAKRSGVYAKQLKKIKPSARPEYKMPYAEHRKYTMKDMGLGY
mgnify:CR=1 FL=1